MTGMRDQLFESIVARQGAVILPGRYGGEAGSDQLAMIQSEENTTLLLGLKVLDATGGLQLSTSAAGNVQYSSAWLREVVGELKNSPSTLSAAIKIQEALETDTLVAGVVCLNSETQQISMHRIAIR